eukprot:249312-Rhodomonas_salina.1
MSGSDVADPASRRRIRILQLRLGQRDQLVSASLFPSLARLRRMIHQASLTARFRGVRGSAWQMLTRSQRSTAVLAVAAVLLLAVSLGGSAGHCLPPGRLRHQSSRFALRRCVLTRCWQWVDTGHVLSTFVKGAVLLAQVRGGCVANRGIGPSMAVEPAVGQH